VISSTVSELLGHLSNWLYSCRLRWTFRLSNWTYFRISHEVVRLLCLNHCRMLAPGKCNKLIPGPKEQPNSQFHGRDIFHEIGLLPW